MIQPHHFCAEVGDMLISCWRPAIARNPLRKTSTEAAGAARRAASVGKKGRYDFCCVASHDMAPDMRRS